MNLICPACGAEVKFKSRFTGFGVCSFCSSTLVRHDMNLETLGKMAELPQDVSPLQIGTSGKYKNSRFEIIGLRKMSWSHGTWNEWYIILDNGKEGWLAEAQGTWAVCFEEEAKIPEEKDLRVGSSYQFGSASYELEDIKETICKGSRGELPAAALHGQKATSADFVAEGGKFASIDYGSKTPSLFLGHYLEFDDFKFSNLREVDGW